MTIVFVLLAILIILGLAMVLTGRWDPQMKGPDVAAPPELPASPWSADDIRNLKFRTGLRGYRMSDVDAALAALAAQQAGVTHPAMTPPPLAPTTIPPASGSIPPPDAPA